MPGPRLASKLGLSDRIFAGPRARKLIRVVEDGLERVDEKLRVELRVGDALADTTSRYLYEAGGKRVRPMLALLTDRRENWARQLDVLPTELCTDRDLAAIARHRPTTAAELADVTSFGPMTAERIVEQLAPVLATIRPDD